ncbi:MAG TPA: TfuA-like protein [Patescibacteria group bacterium]|nr:TfuA-like protein [Patescibacteria group bacterium]
MADAVIFAGPTFTVAEIEKRFGITSDKGTFELTNGNRLVVLGPVSEGDVARLVSEAPAIIAIIDGLYETVPAVWHKEILYAMKEGIHVLGASSMGALRAAELAPFGMEGIGEIYRDFVGGLIEDDDEVAVVHGPAEVKYAPLSDAMVNIRRTVAAATAAGIVSPENAALLLRIGKSLFYKERSYRAIIDMAYRQGVNPQQLLAFKTFIATHRVDQKRLDALALVEIVIARLNRQVDKKQVLYAFEDTRLWRHAGTHARQEADAI